MKKHQLILACTLSLISILNHPLIAQSAVFPEAGDGTETNPYQIGSLENLYWLTQNSIHWDKFFIQTQNINASSTKDWDGGLGFIPIGDTDTTFKGTYNGNGYIIDSLYINRTTGRTGMFGSTAGAAILNIGLTNVDITGGLATGAVTGYSLSTTYEKCFATGIITGNNYTGGLVGGFYGNSVMSDCYADVQVTLTGTEGGGVLGRNRGTVKNTYSLGSVTGNDNFKGAFQGNGYTGSFIENCFWNSTLSTNAQGSGTGNDAGLLALTSDQMTSACTFLAAGWDIMNDTLNGKADIWGFNPEHNNGFPFLSWEDYESHYQVTQLSCTDTLEFTNTIGLSSYTIQGTEADPLVTTGSCDTVTLSNNINQLSSLEGVSFDVGSHSIVWTLTRQDGSQLECISQIIVTGYGQIIVSPSAGDGSEENPFEIASLENLFWLTQNKLNWDKFFIQTQNINASSTKDWDGGLGFIPIGDTDTTFKGTYNGNGHIIDSLYINRTTGRTGMFGNTAGAAILNLGLTNVDITGGLATGAVTGYSLSTTYEKCFATGIITGNNYTGGLVGGFYGISVMSDCYANVQVTLTGTEGGGVLGRNRGTVKNTYSLGSVTGNDNFKGAFQGNGYTGSFIENCFWNSTLSTNAQGSGTGNDAGLLALTSDQMTSACTFLAAGWDIMNDTLNGKADIWGFNPEYNNGFPFLSWEDYESHYQVTQLSCTDTLEFANTIGLSSYTIQGTEADPLVTTGSCDTVTLSNNINQLSSLEGVSFEVGSHNIIWTLTRQDGSQLECTSKINISGYTGYRQIQDGVNIYPNPATDQIKISNLIGNSIIQLLDYRGKIMQEIKTSSNSVIIDVSENKKGFYLIRIVNKNSLKMKKITIN